jgi:predicted O-methyltransferase YrrM
MSTLLKPAVAGLLATLFADAKRTDEHVLPRAAARMKTLDGPMNDRLLGDILDDAYIPVGPEVGRLLYQLVRLKKPQTIVEFGTSFGISTIHMAAAVRDNGLGRIVTTELSEKKAQRAREHIQAAGLADLVEIRQGDAFETLARDNSPIDLLLLDGWKELYLPLLKQLEPRLHPGAAIIGDDLKLMPEMLASYLKHVREESNGYLSLELPMDDGIEISLRV